MLCNVTNMLDVMTPGSVGTKGLAMSACDTGLHLQDVQRPPHVSLAQCHQRIEPSLPHVSPACRLSVSTQGRCVYLQHIFGGHRGALQPWYTSCATQVRQQVEEVSARARLSLSMTCCKRTRT